MKSFRQFVESTGERGRGWFDLPKSTEDSFVVRTAKRRGKPTTKAIPNDTGLAPHSAQKSVLMTRL